MRTLRSGVCLCRSNSKDILLSPSKKRYKLPRSFIRNSSLPFAQQSAATVTMGKQQKRRTTSTMESEKQAIQISQYNRYTRHTNLLQATTGIGVAAAAAAAAPGGSAHR
ncbi:unnamed protein product [Eruca vesicaria subsp. sativa]|uniref:Uncharacterized protein n=1 Tax=Eruca vesicaria subsp. sativa TaxID=29727 RepID=A0ABC8KI04_ERUVS|nr:unnamed protein product [Eruca vesicaria subsp. sativa]